MELPCIWEHNGDDTLLYAQSLPGAYTRGPSLDAALAKMPAEAERYLRWAGVSRPVPLEPKVVQEKVSQLQVADADSDVLFDAERGPLSEAEYRRLKVLALKSAQDLLTLYQAVPDRTQSALPARETFYGHIPRTAEEMYQHTKNVNSYYFGEIGVEADNGGTILDCRARGFALLEQQPGFLDQPPRVGSYDEEWSLAKVLRRFIWHDRIHARALWRMAARTFPGAELPNPFLF